MLADLNEVIRPHGCKIFRITRHAIQAESPLFNIKGGLYAKSCTVILTCKTEGTSIFYTTDGSIPTAKSNLYTDSILIKENTYIRAMSVRSEMAYSFIVSNKFIVRQELINS